jgi:3-hydroxy-9,10-secoandrosta-1,3,5(10)-triene-9,17-dione monooxygenase reductase component
MPSRQHTDAERGDDPSRAPAGLDPARLRHVLGSFPVGVTIVTLFEGAEPRGITVSSFASLSLDPPLVGVAVDRSRSLYRTLRACDRFAVNVLDEGGGPLSDCFAGAPVTPGRDEFCGASWHPGSTGLPLLDAAIATLEVEVAEVHPVGDHDLFVGRVVAMAERAGDALPLVYLRRRYLRIEEASLEDVEGRNEGPSRQPAGPRPVRP